MTTEEIITWKNNFPNILEKARSKANRRYPSILEIDDDAEFGEHDINEAKRDIFIEGYLEAEKDLGWISVKDRLPDTTEYVFTCVEMNGIPQSVGFHYYKDGKWWEGYEEDSVGAVDYWMEVPKLNK